MEIKARCGLTHTPASLRRKRQENEKFTYILCCIVSSKPALGDKRPPSQRDRNKTGRNSFVYSISAPVCRTAVIVTDAGSPAGGQNVSVSSGPLTFSSVDLPFPDEKRFTHHVCSQWRGD